MAMARLDAVQIEMRRVLGEADPETLLCELVYCEERLRSDYGSFLWRDADGLYERMLGAGVCDELVLARAQLLGVLARLDLNGRAWESSPLDQDSDPMDVGHISDIGTSALDRYRRVQAASGLLADLNNAGVRLAAVCGSPAPTPCGALIERAATLLGLGYPQDAAREVARLVQPEFADPGQVLARLVGGAFGVWERDHDMIVELAATPRPAGIDLERGVSPNLSGGPTHGEAEGEVQVYTWPEIGATMLPEQAPSWAALTGRIDWVTVRVGPIAAWRSPIVGSERWEVEERHFVPPESDDDREALDAIDQIGGTVCFIDGSEPDGTLYLSPPSLLVGRGVDADTGNHVLVTVRDLRLQPVAIDDVPFPLDAALLERTATMVGGLLRRTLLSIWSLDYSCPKCGDLGSGRVRLGEGYLVGQYTCRVCRHQWPEQVPTDVMADPDNTGSLAWWTYPVTTTLMPLASARWVPGPFEVTWDWDNGVQMKTTYRRSGEAIEVTVDPEGMVMTLIGPLGLGPKGVQLPITAGPAVARQALVEVLGPATRETVHCPQCGSRDVWPILYGYPETDYHRVEFGGCSIVDGAPDACCQACGHRYRIVDGWHPSVWEAVEPDEDLDIPEWLK